MDHIIFKHISDQFPHQKDPKDWMDANRWVWMTSWQQRWLKILPNKRSQINNDNSSEHVISRVRSNVNMPVSHVVTWLPSSTSNHHHDNTSPNDDAHPPSYHTTLMPLDSSSTTANDPGCPRRTTTAQQTSTIA